MDAAVLLELLVGTHSSEFTNIENGGFKTFLRTFLANAKQRDDEKYPSTITYEQPGLR